MWKWMVMPAVVLVSAALGLGSAQANDVVAKVSSGKLKIKGDADSNVLTIDQAGLGVGAVRVVSGTTTINGVAGPAIFSPVTSLAIDLGEGGDAVNLQAIALAGAVSIKLGPGFDGLGIVTSALGGKVVLDGGGDGNGFRVCNSAIGGDLVIKTASEAGGATATSCGSIVSADNGSGIVVAGSGIGGKLTIKGSKGGESVRLDGSVFGRSTIALADGGDDLAICDVLMGDLTVKMGKAGATLRAAGCGDQATIPSGNAMFFGNTGFGALRVKSSAADDVVIGNLVAVRGPAAVDLGAGANTMNLIQPDVTEKMTVKTGSGRDALIIMNGILGDDVSWKTGNGENFVVLTGTTITGDLVVKTGDGDDSINLSTTTAASKTIKNGAGTDTIIQ